MAKIAHALIDGYNLIKCVPRLRVLHQSLAAARTLTVLSACAQNPHGDHHFLRRRSQSGPSRLPARQCRYIFSRPQKADDLIMERVAQKHGPAAARRHFGSRDSAALRLQDLVHDSPAFTEGWKTRGSAVHGEQDPVRSTLAAR